MKFTSTDAVETDFVEALRKNPGDTATRQVYADWLEQHGFDLRAEYMRSPQSLGFGDSRVRADSRTRHPANPAHL
jgi:uncharacterized protein (TIGR02996 family)